MLSVSNAGKNTCYTSERSSALRGGASKSNKQLCDGSLVQGGGDLKTNMEGYNTLSSWKVDPPLTTPKLTPRSKTSWTVFGLAAVVGVARWGGRWKK